MVLDKWTKGSPTPRTSLKSLYSTAVMRRPVRAKRRMTVKFVLFARVPTCVGRVYKCVRVVIKI